MTSAFPYDTCFSSLSGPQRYVSSFEVHMGIILAIITMQSDSTSRPEISEICLRSNLRVVFSYIAFARISVVMTSGDG